MRSRGVPWVLACAFADVTRWRCGQNGTAEDPGTVRQRVECLDLTSFRRNPECFWRHLKKPRGIVEVNPRFDSVVSRLVDGAITSWITVRTMRFFSRASVVGAVQTLLRSAASVANDAGST